MDSDGLTTTPFCPSRQNQSTASTQLTNTNVSVVHVFFPSECPSSRRHCRHWQHYHQTVEVIEKS